MTTNFKYICRSTKKAFIDWLRKRLSLPTMSDYWSHSCVIKSLFTIQKATSRHTGNRHVIPPQGQQQQPQPGHLLRPLRPTGRAAWRKHKKGHKQMLSNQQTGLLGWKPGRLYAVHRCVPDQQGTWLAAGCWRWRCLSHWPIWHQMEAEWKSVVGPQWIHVWGDVVII